MSDPRWDEPPPDYDELPPDPLDERPADAWGFHASSGDAAPAAVSRSQRPPAAPLRGLDPETVGRDSLELLRKLTGNPDAAFHSGQLEAIQALVVDHRRALVVQRTGWGKSAVYFIAALLQRRAGAGPALIVSPLLALMRDQVGAAERAGVRAAAINSANVTQWHEVERQLDDDGVDVLLVSPERLVNPRFRAEQLPRLINRCGLLVIDEAHCISDWGHDFRPDYRRIRDLIADLPPDVPVLATTATANSRVVTDIEEQLRAGVGASSAAGAAVASSAADAAGASSAAGAAGVDVFTLRGPLARTSLRLGVLQLETDARRLAWLAEHLGDLPGSGIVYCLTVSAAEDTAAMLRQAGHQVRAYTGRTEAAERQEAEEALKANQVKALIATSALGMGFDKPDLGFVVHLGAPSSPVAYYQQVGRAGRATDNADVLLLPGIEDRNIWHYFATNAMPTQAKADQVLAALADGEPLSVAALEARVDIRRSPLELLLKVLAVDGAVEPVSGGWRSTGQPWVYDAQRYERVAEARRAEQQAMLDYERGDRCRMEFLTDALDDPDSHPCGRCDVCAGAWYPTTIGEGSARAAAQVLDRVGVVLEPRKLWPSGLDQLRISADGAPVKGRIKPAEQIEPGRALARLSDLGWGGALRDLFVTDPDGRPIDAQVPANLAKACVRVLAEWDWAQRPAAVVAVPSLSRPQLVESLARGIATVGRMPFLGFLGLAPDAGPLASNVNSAFRVAGVWDRFVVTPELRGSLAGLGGAPVLLVDDSVESRWTMTVAGRLLRRAGSGPVLPFVLGVTG